MNDSERRMDDLPTRAQKIRVTHFFRDDCQEIVKVFGRRALVREG